MRSSGLPTGVADLLDADELLQLSLLLVVYGAVFSPALPGSTLDEYRPIGGVDHLTPPTLHPMRFSICPVRYLPYLSPFTRSTHYITRILAYFFIRWTTSRTSRSELEQKICGLLGRKVSWEAKHIRRKDLG